jgi:REP element-mobilizing transposase RayT
VIIGSHLILHGYGHWLPNDLRGSGSSEVREEKFEPLGEIHFGRKRIQPPREELKAFWREGEELLDHELFWFSATTRELIAASFAQVVARFGYTVWACAILKNHSHLVARRHKDDPETIWGRFADASRAAIRAAGLVDATHQVWSLRPYKVYLNSPSDVRGRIQYVNDNFEKERLPVQTYEFVQPYDGWEPPKINFRSPKRSR